MFLIGKISQPLVHRSLVRLMGQQHEACCADLEMETQEVSDLAKRNVVSPLRDETRDSVFQLISSMEHCLLKDAASGWGGDFHKVRCLLPSCGNCLPLLGRSHYFFPCHSHLTLLL